MRLPKQGLILLLTSSLLLIACATATSSCPIEKQYTEEEQEQAALELERLKDSPIIEKLVADYGVLRAQVRACRET